jgi:hypothetical protein
LNAWELVLTALPAGIAMLGLGGNRGEGGGGQVVSANWPPLPDSRLLLDSGSCTKTFREHSESYWYALPAACLSEYFKRMF